MTGSYIYISYFLLSVCPGRLDCKEFINPFYKEDLYNCILTDWQWLPFQNGACQGFYPGEVRLLTSMSVLPAVSFRWHSNKFLPTCSTFSPVTNLSWWQNTSSCLTPSPSWPWWRRRECWPMWPWRWPPRTGWRSPSVMVSWRSGSIDWCRPWGRYKFPQAVIWGDSQREMDLLLPGPGPRSLWPVSLSFTGGPQRWTPPSAGWRRDKRTLWWISTRSRLVSSITS